MSLASKASLWLPAHSTCTLQTCYQLHATFLTCFYSENKSYEATWLICNFLQTSCESLINSYKRYFTLRRNYRGNKAFLLIQLCTPFLTLCTWGFVSPNPHSFLLHLENWERWFVPRSSSRMHFVGCTIRTVDSSYAWFKLFITLGAHFMHTL